MQDNSMLLELARVVLPEEFVNNFKIVGINRFASSVEFEMDEFAHIPEERKDHKIESKGFLPVATIQDFPIRDKKISFKVRRRKWYDATTQEYFTNNYDITREGTRYSQEFAAFLKELPRDLACLSPFA
ncbi:MAG: hypothetical protein SNG01_04810 [Rikenellaceae bacterium]